MYNFSYWQQHFFELAMQGYETVLGVFLWPLLFMGVIGYIYLKQQSLVAASIVILIFICAFGNVFFGVDELMILLYLFVSLTFTGLLLVFLTKRRN
jgi:hypothetical protein